MPHEDPSANPNPYASPLAAPLEHVASEPLPAEGEGLPWERDGFRWSTYWKTVHLVLFSPTECFQTMFREGRLGAAVFFLVLGGLVGNLFLATIQTGLQMAAFGSMNAMSENDNGAVVATAVVVAVGNYFVAICTSLVCFPVGVLFLAGIFHVALILMGGTHARFETTLRVCIYGVGGTQFVLLVPVICLTQPIWLIAVLILGLAAAHRTSGGKAAAAVMLPFGLCCLGYVGLSTLVAFIISN